MKIIIAGGGTGGHLYPGLAVAEKIQKENPAAEILFVGTETGIERRVVPEEGFPIRFIRAKGFMGKSPIEKVKALLTIFLSVGDSLKIISSFKPRVVIGSGGYASFGMAAAAFLNRIPVLVMEQNAVPGTANRILGHIAKKVAVTYPESARLFPSGKTVVTGNPVRSSLFEKKKEESLSVFGLDPCCFTVLVFGGSAGAKSINTAVVSALPLLRDLRGNVQIIHQCGTAGSSSAEELGQAYRENGIRGVVLPFIRQMAEAYAASDVVICRAGATTIAEITALRKPAILVPYPYAANDHQTANAQRLSERGAAIMIEDRNLTGILLAENIRKLATDIQVRSRMEEKLSSLPGNDAAGQIVSIIRSFPGGQENPFPGSANP